MSDWLGFSLTPQLRIHDEGFGRDDQNTSGASGGDDAGGGGDCYSESCDSMGFLPFRPSPPTHQEWTYENGSGEEVLGGGGGGRKLEDFLGGCYSTTATTMSRQDEGGINMNIPPSSHFDEYNDGNSNTDDHVTERDACFFSTPPPASSPPPSYLLYYGYPHYAATVASNENRPHTCLIPPAANWLRQLHPQPTLIPPSTSVIVPNRDDDHQKSECADDQETNNHNYQQCLSLAVKPVVVVNPMPPSLEVEAVSDSRKRGSHGKSCMNNHRAEGVARKSIDTFGQRTSQYRGVTRHRWTGRYEAHLWDNSCRKEGQTRKGRQVYLGGYDKEEKAARAYDLAALKYWGPTTHINFPLSTYEKELDEMEHMTRQEFVANLRRKSSGFSRGASVYRGVTRHHQHGRWQARIGRVAGNKDLYLGTFSTQEEAAEAYDIAAIKFRGTSAVTNFNISRYDVKRICSSSTLIAGDLAKRSPKETGPTTVEDYNSCASSTSPEPLLAITNGEPSDELADMLWPGKEEQEQEQSQAAQNTTNEENECSNPQNTSPIELGSEFDGCSDYPQTCFAPTSPIKHGDSNDGNRSSNQAMGEKLERLGLVNQVPVFAMWNQ